MSSTKISKHDIDDSVLQGIATEDFVEEKISEIPTPDVSGQIAEHNISLTAHDGILAKKVHTHVPSEVGISYGTTDIEAGTSSLESGKIYLVHE